MPLTVQHLEFSLLVVAPLRTSKPRPNTVILDAFFLPTCHVHWVTSSCFLLPKYLTNLWPFWTLHTTAFCIRLHFLVSPVCLIIFHPGPACFDEYSTLCFYLNIFHHHQPGINIQEKQENLLLSFLKPLKLHQTGIYIHESMFNSAGLTYPNMW